MRIIIWLARLVNIVYYYSSLITEKLFGQEKWTKELEKYYRISSKEVVSNYQLKTKEFASLWRRRNRHTVGGIHSFYKESEYPVYRQVYFNRHKIFMDIALGLFLKKRGNFCEYGSGVGPVSAKLISKYPNWRFHLTDLDSPHLKFAKWRLKKFKNARFGTVTTAKPFPLGQQFEIIVCKQVLEHVINPLALVKHLLEHLKPGGWLYLDYIYNPGKENLIESAKMRKRVLRYLRAKMEPVFAVDPDKKEEGYGLYLKSL